MAYFIRGAQLTKSIIVGVDPGITVGIAILDTKGNIIDLVSKREAKKSDLIKHISKFGKPVIIASDVNPLPKMIGKLASALGSEVFYPETSLSNAEKVKIIKKYIDEIKNLHQKDALAASLKAFKKYHELFLKIEETLIRMHHEKIFDEVLGRMLKKRNENIVDVTKKIIAKKEKR